MSTFGGYRVLRVRNYRLMWIGNWISLIGTWMQSVTQAWLLTKLTDSPLALGILGAASSAPFLVFVLIGGIVSDRFDRRSIVIMTQALSLLQALTLAILTLAGVIQPWHIIGLAAVLGAINAFDIPARQAFVIELVAPSQLPNALALNSTAFNVARVVGPAIGGGLVALTGEGVCFLVNALSYLAVLAALTMMDPAAISERQRLQQGQRGAFLAGARFVARNPDLARILVLVGLISSVAIPYRNFLPDIAQNVLHIGATRYGLLMAAAGAGATLGAVTIAGLSLTRDHYNRLLPVGLLGFCITLGAFSQSTRFVPALLLLVGMGVCGILYFNAANTLVQLSIDDLHRGRVMSFYVLMQRGVPAFGSLLLGLAAHRYGTPSALLGGAVLCTTALVGFVVTRRRATASATLEASGPDYS